MRSKIMFGRIIGWLLSIWSFLPILFGVLMPMFIYFPIAYSSWRILTIFIGESSYYNYLNSWFTIYPSNLFLISNLVFFEVSIFLIGFGIFLYGLITLIKGRMRGEGIVQTGLYRYIRHPQNLGIILFLFAFILYIPGFGDMGIRIADILSWILFCMFMVVICDLEEFRMKQKFSQDYENYCNKTGFFLPRMRKHDLKLIKNKKIVYVIRYSVMIVIFIVIVNITNIIAKFLYINDIVEIYR